MANDNRIQFPLRVVDDVDARRGGFAFIGRLWIFVLPAALVYWAGYAAGVWV